MHIKHDSILSNQCFNNYRRLCFNNNLMCKCWCTKLLSLFAGTYVARKTMNEWMDEFNECVISRPTAIQGMSLNIMIAGSAARRWLFCLWVREPWCEWKSEPDDKNYIAQVVRYLLLSSIIMTAGASLHTSVNQHAQRHWCITPVVWQRHQDTHRSAIRPHRALAQTLKRNDTDTWEIGQKDTKQTELSMW